MAELFAKNIGSYKMSDTVVPASEIQEKVAQLEGTDAGLLSRAGALETRATRIEHNLDLVTASTTSGTNYRGVFNSLVEVTSPHHGDVVLIRSGASGEYTHKYVFTVPEGESVGSWLLFGEEEKVYAVNSLPEPSAMTDLNIGRIYLLKELQEGYIQGHFYKVIKNGDAFEYQDFSTIQNVPLGAVQNIRFSFISGTLTLYWQDPDDVVVEGTVVSKWAKTVLVVKTGSYPTDPTDGTMVVSSTIKNQYLSEPAVIKLDPASVWYCRFFPQNESGVYTIDSPTSPDNKFKTDVYSWTDVAQYLEEYAKYKRILPQAGDTVYLDYIISDYYRENDAISAANTRQLVMDNMDKLSSVAYPWRILGYNSNVPQYIKYRSRREGKQCKSGNYDVSETDPMTGVITFNKVVYTDYTIYDKVYYRDVASGALVNYMYDGTQWHLYDAWAVYDYMWVSSVDDTLSSFNIYNIDGSFKETKDFMVGEDEYYGPGWQRSIVAGVHGYDMTYDARSGVKSYTDNGKTILSVIDPGDKFAYNNGGNGTQNVYYAPITLSASDNRVYKFCGYTMTVQPQNCLNGVAITSGQSTAHYTNIQFDASENQYGSVYSIYDTPAQVSDDYGYYWRDGQDLHVIDVMSENLGGRPAQVYNGHDVYKAEPFRQLKMQTAYFERYHDYVLASDRSTLLTGCLEYQTRTAYAVNEYVATYADPSDEEPNAIYIVTTAVPATNTNPPATNTSFTLDTTRILEDHRYAIWGRRCTTAVDVEERVNGGTSRVSYGCNLYSISNYRQYVNNLNGKNDVYYMGKAQGKYEPQSRFDKISTTGLFNVNGPMLKLSKNADFVAQIVPASNITVVSTNSNQHYQVRARSIGGTWVQHLCDLFWPLANTEAFGTNNDGTVWFQEVLGSDSKRVKFDLKANGQKNATANWWLRYPHTGYVYTEYHVTTSGTSGSLGHPAATSYGCVPACLIG